jgi:hypothetical protein
MLKKERVLAFIVFMVSEAKTAAADNPWRTEKDRMNRGPVLIRIVVLWHTSPIYRFTNMEAHRKQRTSAGYSGDTSSTK